jgi:integrase
MSVAEATHLLAGRKLVRTSTPGIFKRGGAYCIVYRDPSGKQRKRSARTLAEARDLKASLTADVRRGEWRAQSAVTFADHWQPWLDSYAGRTARGFRENTREDYRRDLEVFAVPFFGRMKLAAIEPSTVKRFLVEMAVKGYAAGTIRNALAPVRAMLADAAEDGIIRFNPAAGVRIPANAKRADGSQAKALTTAELERLRASLETDDDRLLIDFLVATGLRVSECMGLDWSHVELGHGRIRVEQRLYRGMDAPKSRTSRRVVKVSPAMVGRLGALWQSRGCPPPSEPVFVSPKGARLDYSNLHKRIVPAMRAAGIEDGAFHRLRHTTGTELKRRGADLGQIQAHLGHHDLAFTKRVYVHVDGEEAGPDPSLLDDLSGCAAAPRRLEVVAP